MDKIIGFVHLVWAIFISMYAFLIKKNSLDMAVIIYQVLVLMSWTFFNGECFLTYLIKRKNNGDYQAGEQSTDLEDMRHVIGNSKTLQFAQSFFVIVNAVSLYLVLKRNDFSWFIVLPLSLCMLVYPMSLRLKSKNIHKDRWFLILQECVKYVVLVCFILILKELIRY
jgi:hypothetical protein